MVQQMEANHTQQQITIKVVFREGVSAPAHVPGRQADCGQTIHLA